MGPLIITRLWPSHKDPFRKKEEEKDHKWWMLDGLFVCLLERMASSPFKRCQKWGLWHVLWTAINTVSNKSKGLAVWGPWLPGFDWQLLQCFFRKLEFSYAFTCMNAVALYVFTDWTVEGLDNLKILVSLLSLRYVFSG